MTHDELLAKVDTLEARYTDYPTYLALRAVVELHRPEKQIIKGFKNEYWCMADNNELTPYPCPTIQAIEKELG